jgi:hypothetical protein
LQRSGIPNNKHEYAVDPEDRTDAKDIQVLLDRAGGVETTRSQVDTLVLFWTIKLTNAQGTNINAHPQITFYPTTATTKNTNSTRFAV